MKPQHIKRTWTTPPNPDGGALDNVLRENYKQIGNLITQTIQPKIVENDEGAREYTLEAVVMTPEMYEKLVKLAKKGRNSERTTKKRIA